MSVEIVTEAAKMLAAIDGCQAALSYATAQFDGPESGRDHPDLIFTNSGDGEFFIEYRAEPRTFEELREHKKFVGAEDFVFVTAGDAITFEPWVPSLRVYGGVTTAPELVDLVLRVCSPGGRYYEALNGAMARSRELRRGLDGPPCTLRYFLTPEAAEAGLEPPKRAYPGDAGFDLRCFTDNDIRIDPHEHAAVPTGVGFEIPDGWYGLICNRTSLAKRGLIPLAQVVDSNFTGDLTLTLHNTGAEPLILQSGERIAQIVIMPVSTHELVRIEPHEIKKIERGTGQYGSSGKF